jgi:hypothetical protein
MQEVALVPRLAGPLLGVSSCEHRTVSKDGRIICTKIVEGDNEVSPNLCRTCPTKAINCAHLRFSLRQISPSPLIVRFNGRTEVWDDDPPEICLAQAACAARIMPVEQARSCAGCTLRQPVKPVVEQPPRSWPQAQQVGKVVPFPGRQVAAAAG